MLIGETRRSFDKWKMDGLPYEQLLIKLKEYARSQRLDGEAARGKQAVDLNKTISWADQLDGDQAEEEPVQTEEELNALSNVKCFYCNKKRALYFQVPNEKGPEEQRQRQGQRERQR